MPPCRAHSGTVVSDGGVEGGTVSTETDSIAKPYRMAAGEGVADIWWKAGRMTVKAGAAETGSSFAQLEISDPRGGAPPWHVHRNEDEAFYVLEGEVTILVGDERIDLSPGDYAFAPRGIPHAYIVRSEQARMLVTTSQDARVARAATGRPIPDIGAHNS